MGRSADYTIQGFLYQFNMTLSELLKAADEAEIVIEGIVEDIEVATFSGTKAIQCKYHEAQSDYSLSILYDPLLQMMKSFKSNPTAKIEYHLFAHFPGSPSINISANDLNAALSSSNRNLQKLIVETKGVDIEKFLEVFFIKITPKYDDLMEENIRLLVDLGFNRSDVETMFYPNAIQIIGDKSIKHHVSLRKITRKFFLSELRRIRSTAVSQWTLGLKTRKKILDSRRKQLKVNLNVNSRLRYLLVFPNRIEEFDSHIVLFIKSFINKYHFKQTHTHTPIFILDVVQSEFEDIAERLFLKEVIPNTGCHVKAFSEKKFFSDPIVTRDKKEFSLRLIRWDDYKRLDHKVKADDFFVIGDGDITELDVGDINLEVLFAEKFDEIKYMMGIINDY